MLRSLASIGLGLTVALGAAGGAAAQGFGSFGTLWVQPAERAGGERGCARLLLAELPADWQTGDAAAVVMTPRDGTTPEDLQARLVEALVRDETAVLDYPAGRPGADCPGRVAPPLAELFGALDALVGQAGAGLVVAIGFGPYGDAVLAATEEGLAASILGAGGPRLAAAIAIDAPGRARFAMGATPHPFDAWPDRAPLLCGLIASVAGLDGPQDCVAALVRPQAEASLVRPRR
jgi:hypothetical protein